MAEDSDRGYVFRFQALQFATFLPIEGSGYLIMTGPLNRTHRQSDEREQTGFSFERVYAKQRNIQGEGKAFGGSYAYTQSVEASWACSHDNRFYGIHFCSDLL
jgi:hypothetical protein